MPMVLECDLSVRLHRPVMIFVHSRRAQLPEGDLEGRLRTSGPPYKPEVPSVDRGVLAPSDKSGSAEVASLGDRVERSFLPAVEAVTDAHHFTYAALRKWQVRAPEVGQLVVAELATKALRRGSGFRVSLNRRRDSVRVEVSDLGPATPDAIHPPSEAIADLGLRIVDHLATGWGSEFVPGVGRVVWAQLEAA